MKRENQKLFNDFYDGNADAIFRHFIGRRIADGVRADERITINDFYFQNDIRVIQDTRVSFMPKTFDVYVSGAGKGGLNDAITRRVREWLDTRHFGGGRSFWEAFPGICLTQENCGTVFLKLFVKEGEVSVQKMYSDDVDVIVDEKNYLDVMKYVFSWEEKIDLEGGGFRVVKMTEEIDDKAFTTTADGRPVNSEEHRFGFVPVVRILREEVEGSPYGRSGIEDLIEAQQNVNMALTKRAWATKYNSFRVWAPKEAGYIESGTTIRISPGALSPIPIEAVGGDVDLSAVERELDDALDHLYRLGSVPRRLKDDMVRASTSAKALNSMLEGLKRYTERKLVYMRRGLEEMILKYLKIEYNRDDFKVTISFPSLDREDPEHTLNRARFLAEHGMEAEALKEIGFDVEAAGEGEAKK